MLCLIPTCFPRLTPSSRNEFERITEGLSDALEFTRTIGMGQDGVSYEQGGGRGPLGEVDFYTRLVINGTDGIPR